MCWPVCRTTGGPPYLYMRDVRRDAGNAIEHGGVMGGGVRGGGSMALQLRISNALVYVRCVLARRAC